MKALLELIALIAAVSAIPMGTDTQHSGRGPGLLPPPPGGVQLKSDPDYHFNSEFDFQSFNLVLQVEHIEFDLFGYGLERWNDEDFENVGLGADDRALIAFFQQQEIGHEIAAARLMGRPDLADARCEYQYPNFTSILDWLDFNQKSTRFGESGVLGFLGHLNDRSTGAILLETVTTEARQQYSFRQLEGLFPTTVWFIPGITQSMTWTLLAPYIKSCPKRTPKIGWNNFPALKIESNPGPPGYSNVIATVTGPLTRAGREIRLTWESPGKRVGPDDDYITRSDAGEPKYVAWISQLNTIFTRLENISGNSGTTIQPGGDMRFNGTTYEGNPSINGTMFILVTDARPNVTPFNLTYIEPHIVAGPALYQSG